MSLLDRVSRMAREAMEGAKDQKEIVSHRWDIHRLEGQRKEAFEELGEKVFQLYTDGQFHHEELQEVWDKIESLNRRIQAKEHDIERIKEEPGGSERDQEPAPEGELLCPECGHPITPEMCFCAECGTKLTLTE